MQMANVKEFASRNGLLLKGNALQLLPKVESWLLLHKPMLDVGIPAFLPWKLCLSLSFGDGSFVLEFMFHKMHCRLIFLVKEVVWNIKLLMHSCPPVYLQWEFGWVSFLGLKWFYKHAQSIAL